MSESEFKQSFLVQRLRKPIGKGTIFDTFGGDNPFSFGGGLKNGGLSDEAMGLLRGIFSFDYMGSAEFEFGAVPEALQKIAKNAEHLIATVTQFPFTDVTEPWQPKGEKKILRPEGQATVWLLCQEDDVDRVAKRVHHWASIKSDMDRSDESYLKETTRLARALWPSNEWDADTQGWLELDNGFFFFTNKDMWAATAALFDVKVPTG